MTAKFNGPDPRRYPQHPVFGTPKWAYPTPGFLDQMGRHCDGWKIAAMAGPKFAGKKVMKQIKAAGAGEAFSSGTTPWMLPYTFTEEETRDE